MPNYMDYQPPMSGPAQQYSNRMSAENNQYSNGASDLGLLNMMAQQHPGHSLDLAAIHKWLERQRMDMLLHRMMQDRQQRLQGQSQQDLSQQGPAGWQYMQGLPYGGNGRTM